METSKLNVKTAPKEESMLNGLYNKEARLALENTNLSLTASSIQKCSLLMDHAVP